MNAPRTAFTHLKEEVAPALVIAKREVSDQFRDWRVIFPILGFTAFFPYLMNYVVSQILDFVAKYSANIIGERMVPFLLMIVGFFPITISLVIALDSFVGEKERGSIEALLNTPLKDWQLYLGKLLSSTVPPLAGSYIGMIVYLVTLAMRDIPLPSFNVLLIIFILSTFQSVMMVSGAVVLSVQATTIRAANLLASLVIIPSAFLMQVEALVMFYGKSINILWYFILGLIVLSVLLIRVGLSHFQREKLLGRVIDVLNVRWMVSAFWQLFRGRAKNLFEWYRVEVFGTLRQMRSALWICAVLSLLGLVFGMTQTRQFFLPADLLQISPTDERIGQVVDLFTSSSGPIFGIWFQNTRVILLASLLGFLSFGMIGLFPMLASITLVGYLSAMLTASGLPLINLLILLLPHGIIEIPALIIGTAAILHTGARIVAPAKEKNLGEIWIESLADWAKLIFALVLPAFLIAALIEAQITPRLLQFFFN
ncbi:MAG: stage II sporulation protein M [Anaerolineaceae bacterium]|nr:stage II sporulation protein M [Anaerolineaceae bacterium]